MDIKWTSHLPENQQEDFQRLVLNSTTVLRRLYQIIDEDEKALDRQETSIKDFEDPNWSHKQAFRLGDRSRLRKIKHLISFAK